MQKYHTYIINYYNGENDFDYFIFHSKTALKDKDNLNYNKSEIIKQFKKLRREYYGVRENIQIDQIIEYIPKNYPNFREFGEEWEIEKQCDNCGKYIDDLEYANGGGFCKNCDNN